VPDVPGAPPDETTEHQPETVTGKTILRAFMLVKVMDCG
jgi:hypothetical protein